MSWGASSSGKTKAVAAEIRKQCETAAGYSHMDKIEGGFALATADLVDKVLGDTTEPAGVTVSCSGSLSSHNGKREHSLKIDIQPLWNWVE